MVSHHTASPGRYQCLAQAIQPDQTSSRIKHAPTRPRNPIRETKNEWANIGGWTVRNKETGQYIKTEKFVANPTPQVLFLEICIKLLKEGGRLGIVVPESMISNASSAHVVHYLLSNMRLEAVIGMPENLFKTSGKGGTHTKTCLIIASKSEQLTNDYDFFMAEAKWC